MARKPINRPVTFSDDFIKKLFINKKVSHILYLDKAEELKHIRLTNNVTKDTWLKIVTAEMYKLITNDPKCIITITDKKAIQRNRFSNKLEISTKLIEPELAKDIEYATLKLTLKYNLLT